MKKIFFFAFTLLVCTCTAQSNIQNTADSLANIYLQHQTGALVICIFDKGQEKIFYYGETEKGNHVLPDSNSLFEIGSITETFTCLLFADLTVKGLMGIDDPLQKYLPVNVPSPVFQQMVCRPADKTLQQPPIFQSDEPFAKYNFTPYSCLPDSSVKPQPILLCYLSTHTSGLPDVPYNLKKNKKNPYSNYSKEKLYDYLRSSVLNEPIGFDYKHSALGISLLGHAMSLKMKKDFDSLLMERVLTPMNLTSTVIQVRESQQKYFLSGHDSNGNIVKHWTYKVFEPSGALRSSPTDMMRFLSANIGSNKNYFSDLLDFSHNARLKSTEKKSKGMQIALGWKINPLGKEGKNIVWQEGRTGGFASYIGFVETSHTGVMILSSVSKNVNEIGVELLQKLESKKSESSIR
jgi:D-alanyl-D-alanine-carboxypeptidase/D-alanyl-D-alanine-endopeptidase